MRPWKKSRAPLSIRSEAAKSTQSPRNPRLISTLFHFTGRRHPEDATFVPFEQTLTRGLIAAAEAGQRPRVGDGLSALQPLDGLYAELDRGIKRVD
jgi:hypothetical protein